jgi:transcriptional regulator with XRE-family HTH domain
MSVALGRAIAAVRVERGLKRMELVTLGQISYPFLAEIEHGRKSPSHQTLARLAAALRTTPAGLMARAESITADPRNWL